MAGLFSTLLEGGVAGAGIANQLSNLSDLGDFAVDQTTELANTAKADTEFKPFSVTSSLGNVQTDGVGGITSNLGAEQLALQQQLQAGASGMFSAATADQTSREQSIFEQLMATVNPQYERDKAALESRLHAQGRSGIRSEMFGGSPEQLAQAKAREEALFGVAGQARNIASAEQLQNSQIGSQLLNDSYLPEAQLFDQFNPAVQTGNLAQTGQIAGANLGAQLGLGGVESRVNAEKLRSEILSGAFNQASGIAGAAGQAFDDTKLGTQISDFLKDLF